MDTPPQAASLRLCHNPAPHYNTFLLNVEFATEAGDEWSAIGGGDSIPEAIAAARDALPPGPDWELVRWNHFYGDRGASTLPAWG